MFKVNNKDRIMSFWCLYCQFWTYFRPYSTGSIVNFDYVITGWVVNLFHAATLFLYSLKEFLLYLTSKKGLLKAIPQLLLRVLCVEVVEFKAFLFQSFYILFSKNSYHSLRLSETHNFTQITQVTLKRQ